MIVSRGRLKQGLERREVKLLVVVMMMMMEAGRGARRE